MENRQAVARIGRQHFKLRLRVTPGGEVELIGLVEELCDARQRFAAGCRNGCRYFRCDKIRFDTGGQFPGLLSPALGGEERTLPGVIVRKLHRPETGAPCKRVGIQGGGGRQIEDFHLRQCSAHHGALGRVVVGARTFFGLSSQFIRKLEIMFGLMSMWGWRSNTSSASQVLFLLHTARITPCL